MITIGKHPDIPEAELQAYLNHANNTYPHRDGVVNIALDGDYVDLSYDFDPVPFQRIRRITGYGMNKVHAVGTLDRFNNAKRREVEDRVKHTEV